MRRLRAAHARRALATGVALLVTLVAPGAALAATCPRTSVADLEDEVMCPVCKTTLGLAQEAPQADRERAFILERVEQCQSKRQIKAALVAEFGDEVLAEPQSEGFDLAAYVVPALGLAAGLALCAFAFVRWRRRRPGAGGESAPASAPTPANARLERDLERYDL